MRCFASTDTLKPLRFELAAGLWSRMRGLLGSVVCNNGEVLALVPCRSIHTFGMREAIDVAFVSRQGCVLKAVRKLPPNRLLSFRGAFYVLERRSGDGDAWFELGDVVELVVWPTEG
jgi:uncharacterized membrane protein (UPF0127 family)